MTPDVFTIESRYPFRLSYIHPLSGKLDGVVRYFSTEALLAKGIEVAHRPCFVERFDAGAWWKTPHVFQPKESR